MSLSKSFQYAGCILTAGIIAGAGALDFRSEQIADERISAINMPLMERFNQCQSDGCGTDRNALNRCLEDKAGQMHGDIRKVQDQRGIDKIVYRTLMVLGAAYLSFLLLQSRRREREAATPRRHSP